MNNLDPQGIAIGLLLTAPVLAAAYWWYRRNRPIHTFVGIDFGAQSVVPKRIRNLHGPFKVKRNDKKTVQFPIPNGFAHHRQDGRGTMFFGDLETGQLLRVTREEGLFDAVDGIFLEKAAADARVEQMVTAIRGGGVTMKHLLIGIGIIVVLVCVNIYQYANSGGL